MPSETRSETREEAAARLGRLDAHNEKRQYQALFWGTYLVIYLDAYTEELAKMELES